tara:strand:+ start:247 stop:426 length:180 start_codon:yes stop_codon:yes gene_type:complete
MYFYKNVLKLKQWVRTFVKDHIVDNDPYDMNFDIKEEDISMKECNDNFEDDYENQPFGD